jgi:hypothetical protein
LNRPFAGPVAFLIRNRVDIFKLNFQISPVKGEYQEIDVKAESLCRGAKGRMILSKIKSRACIKKHTFF